jgi:hypothetical protein
MRGALAVVALLGLGSIAAQAHHSIAAVYDRTQPVRLDGIVVEFALVHPHPFLVIDVGDDTRGRQRWRGEMDNRWELEAIGMSAGTFRAGDRVVVSGSVARTQPHALYILRLDRPADGFWYEQVGMSPRVGRR